MARYYLLLCTIILFSCGTKINYLGSNYIPTKNVDIYVDATAIKKKYTVVGKGYIAGHSYFKNSIDKMQQKIINKAKEKGADAVLFQDYYIVESGKNIHSVIKTDSIGKALISVKNTTIGPVISSQRDILFLKYD